MRFNRLSVVVALALFAAACNDDDGPAPPTATPVGVLTPPGIEDLETPADGVVGPEDAVLTIIGVNFDQESLLITVGTPVTIQNGSTDEVNIIINRLAPEAPEDPEEITSATISPEESFEHTFESVGTYEVVSDTHFGMRAAITVIE